MHVWPCQVVHDFLQFRHATQKTAGAVPKMAPNLSRCSRSRPFRNKGISLFGPFSKQASCRFEGRLFWTLMRKAGITRWQSALGLGPTRPVAHVAIIKARVSDEMRPALSFALTHKARLFVCFGLMTFIIICFVIFWLLATLKGVWMSDAGVPELEDG